MKVRITCGQCYMRYPAGEKHECIDVPGEERRRLRKRIAFYEGILRRVREDINWMLNERKFLNSDVFDYLDAALGDDALGDDE